MNKKVVIVGTIFFTSFCLLLMAYKFYLRRYYLPWSTLNSNYWNKQNDYFRKMKNIENATIFIGNSLTEKFDLSQLNNSSAINMGISSDYTEGVLKRVQNISHHRPKKIFIEIGINDILAEVDFDEVKQNCIEIISVIKRNSPSTKIYIQNLLPVNFKNGFFVNCQKANVQIIEMNSFLKKLCLKNNLEYIDLHFGFRKNGVLNPSLTTDGVHLNKDGYSLWTKIIYPYVNGSN